MVQADDEDGITGVLSGTKWIGKGDGTHWGGRVKDRVLFASSHLPDADGLIAAAGV